MTPALMGLTLAGLGELSAPFGSSFTHINARFLAALAVAAYLAAAAPWSAAMIG